MSTSALEMPGTTTPLKQQEYGGTSTMEEPSGNALLTSPYQLQSGGSNGSQNNGHVRLPDHDEEDGDDNDDDESSEGDEEENEMSIAELLYSSSSYHAIVKPVTLTMTLAALAVVFINTEETWQQGEAQMQEAYTVWNVDDQDTTSGKLTTSLANTLVMVSVICAMTFVIVFCYKMRCMKFLIGYMIFASATLLGLLGGTMFEVAIEKWKIPIDVISFYWFMYNFAIVGVLSIFWSLGIPSYITQGYLIATSVILAWQLAHFDVWTIWCLLFMLACYDLCAVLTPCGPLRALVNLMSKDDAPEMPGLLYEAELPPEAQRPGVPRTSAASNARASAPAPAPPPPPPTTISTNTHDNHEAPAVAESCTAASSADETEASGANGVAEGRTAVMPLAIARVYNLDVIALSASNASRSLRRNRPTGVSTSPLLGDGEDAAVTAATADAIEIPENPTPKQLRSDVTVRLPQRGGTIEKMPSRGRKKVYLERDRHGNPKRTIWVDRQGKVFAETEDDDEAEGGGSKRGNSIRLGLGDFIFYSVLVAKAAMYSFATFASCMLVILAGLGGTLVLLSVYHHALPALPISIFLAIGFYLVTRLAIQPWIEEVMRTPLYV